MSKWIIFRMGKSNKLFSMELACCNRSDFRFRKVLSFAVLNYHFLKRESGLEKNCWDPVPLNLNKKKQDCMKCFNFPTELQTKKNARRQWLVF